MLLSRPTFIALKLVPTLVAYSSLITLRHSVNIVGYRATLSFPY